MHLAQQTCIPGGQGQPLPNLDHRKMISRQTYSLPDLQKPGQRKNSLILIGIVEHKSSIKGEHLPTISSS